MLNQELLARAKTTLQYDPTALSARKEIEQREENEKAVAIALEALGIEPLDKSAVKKYKAEKEKEVERKGSNRFVQYMHSTSGEPAVGGAGFAAVASFIVWNIALATASSVQSVFTHRHAYEVTAAGSLCCWALGLLV